MRVFQHAQLHPILSIRDAGAKTGISFPTVASAVAYAALGVLREITPKRRKRLSVYDAYRRFERRDRVAVSLKAWLDALARKRALDKGRVFLLFHAPPRESAAYTFAFLTLVTVIGSIPSERRF
jgi:hypothetical protein